MGNQINFNYHIGNVLMYEMTAIFRHDDEKSITNVGKKSITNAFH